MPARPASPSLLGDIRARRAALNLSDFTGRGRLALKPIAPRRKSIRASA
jgi:hypothetical protein